MSGLPKPNDFSRVIVTTMKDEGPYILDWVSYHFSIGFTHIIILTNDCSDGTDKICRHLEKLGVITHKNNKEPYPKGIQKTAYKRIEKLEAYEQAEWVMALDVDEYLRIDIGNCHLDDVFKWTGNRPAAISFMWQVFGNNQITQLEDRPVAAQFTKSTSTFQIAPYQTRGLKTIFRRDCFKRIGTHRPLEPNIEFMGNKLWIDANGVPLPQMLEKPYWQALNDGTGFGWVLGRVNHYALRSRTSFMLKMHRGFVNRTSGGIRGENSPSLYWRFFNWNVETNEKILPGIGRANALKAELLMDKKLARLHQQAYDFHLEKANELVQSKWWTEADREINLIDLGLNFNAFDQKLMEYPILNWELSPIRYEDIYKSSIFKTRIDNFKDYLHIDGES